MRLRNYLAPCAIALLSSVQRAGADSIAYTNGPISGATGAWNISTDSVSDSFTISNPTQLAEAEVGLWSQSGSPASLDWSIGTSAFLSNISSGASSLTDSLTGFHPGNYSVYDSTFALSATLAPGTYWLTLTSAAPGPVSWDENDGPSTAYISTSPNPIGSESFTLFAATPVPKSGTAALPLLGAFALSRCLTRRKSAAINR